MAKAKRTTHRSASGKKLYAVRDASGKFKDIQTYERAQERDIKKKSIAEKKKAKKAAPKKKSVKKVARKTTPKKKK
jgi:uncharacterized protein YjhX (UPF0386 family)